MQREFTAVFEKRGRWYVAYVEEIPCVNTQGKTLSEVRENLKDTLLLILEENRRLSGSQPFALGSARTDYRQSLSLNRVSTT